MRSIENRKQRPYSKTFSQIRRYSKDKKTLVPSNSASFIFPHCSRRKSVPGSQESGGLDVEYVLLKVAATGFHIMRGPGSAGLPLRGLSPAPREQKKSSVKSNLTQNAALYRLTCPIPRRFQRFPRESWSRCHPPNCLAASKLGTFLYLDDQPA